MADETQVYTLNMETNGFEEATEQLNAFLERLENVQSAYQASQSASQQATSGTQEFTSAIQEQISALTSSISALSQSIDSHTNLRQRMSENATGARDEAAAFKEMAGGLQVAQVSLDLFGDSGGAAGQVLNNLSAAAFAFGSAANAAASAGLNPLVIAVGALASVLVGVGAGLIDTAVKVQTMGTDIKAAGDLSDEGLQEIQQSMISISTESGEAFTDVDEALSGTIGQLRAYYGEEDTLSGETQFMTSATELAVTTNENLSDVTGGLSDVMRAYGESLGDTANVANLLYQASLDTGMSIESLGESLGRLAARGGDLANNLPQVVQLLVDMNAQGLSGGRSIQILTSALEKINDPSDTFVGLLKDMNVNIGDFMALDLNGRLDTIADAYANSNTQQQQWIAEEVAGTTDTGLFQNILEQLVSGGFDNLNDSLQDSNKLLEDYDDKQNTAAQHANKAKEDFQSLAVMLSGPLATAVVYVGGAFAVFGTLAHEELSVLQEDAQAAGDFVSGIAEAAQSASDVISGDVGDAVGQADAAKNSFSDIGTQVGTAMESIGDFGSQIQQAWEQATTSSQQATAAIAAQGDAAQGASQDNSDLASSSDDTTNHILTQAEATNQLTENEDAYGKTVGEVKDKLNDYLSALASAGSSKEADQAKSNVLKEVDELATDIDNKVGNGAGLAWKNSVLDQLNQIPDDLDTSDLASQMADVLNPAFQEAAENFSDELNPPKKVKAPPKVHIPGSTETGLAESALGTPDQWVDIAGTDADKAIEALNEAFAKGVTDTGAGSKLGNAIKSTLNEAVKEGAITDQDTFNQLSDTMMGLAEDALAGDSDAAAQLTDILHGLGTATIDSKNAMDAAATSSKAWSDYNTEGANAADQLGTKIDQLNQDMAQLSSTENDALGKENQDYYNSLNVDNLKSAVDQATQSYKDMESAQQDVEKMQSDIAELAQNQADAVTQLESSQADQRQDAQQSHQDQLEKMATEHAQKLADINRENSKDKQKEIDDENHRYANETANESTSYAESINNMDKKDQEAQARLAAQQVKEQQAAADKRAQEIAQEAERAGDATAEAAYKQTLQEELGISEADIAKRNHDAKMNQIRDEADLKIAEDQRTIDQATAAKAASLNQSLLNDVASGKISMADAQSELLNQQSQFNTAMSAISNDQASINIINRQSSADAIAAQTPVLTQDQINKAYSDATAAALSARNTAYQNTVNQFNAAGGAALLQQQPTPSITPPPIGGSTSGTNSLPNVGTGSSTTPSPSTSTPSSVAAPAQAAPAVTNQITVQIVTESGQELANSMLSDKDFQNGVYKIVMSELSQSTQSAGSFPLGPGGLNTH